MDSGDGIKSTSYIGGPLAWVSLEGMYNKPLNHSINISLEPYTGVDTNAPIIRNISGTECFMDQNAEILLEVQEQNSVITPITAEYTLNGGTIINYFFLVPSKSNNIFTGLLPSQEDGTIANVKFHLEDDQGNSTISDMYVVEWSKYFSIYEENFERGISPPENWDMNSSGSGWTMNYSTDQDSTVNSRLYSMTHLSHPEFQDDWMISPFIFIPRKGSSTLSFFQSGEFIEYIFLHEISVTTDNGITWQQIYLDNLPITNLDVKEYFTKKYLSLNDYQGQNVRIGWHYKGQNGDNWYIDDVTVFYDDEVAVIEDISSNTALLPEIGAYLNNNMVIDLTVTDNFGVNSITGFYNFEGEDQTHQISFFSMEKEQDLWSGTIYASEIEKEGFIYFDIEDVSGNLATSINYPIKFVKDTEGPVIKEISGLRSYVDDYLRFEVTINDESDLGYCLGSYSKDNWATEFNILLSPSKVKKHVYKGVFPPESTEVLDGKLILKLRDVENNESISDEYIIKWTYPYSTKFDLRTAYEESHVTSVKKQEGGTCWTFASMASIESNMIKSGIWEAVGETGEPDLAEYHLDWWNGFNQNNNDDLDSLNGGGLTVHQGGDYRITAAYLSRGEGVVRNLDAQLYDTAPLRSSDSYHYYYPRDIEWYTTDNTFRSFDLIKEKVIEHGAIGTCIAYSPSFLTGYVHYQPHTDLSDPNHAVTIVGWDDDLYTEAPEGNGAWLIKNSWSVSWGDEGYFWVSYYDKHCTKNVEMGAVSFYNVEPLKYDNVYSHDYHGWRDTMPDVREVCNAFTTKKAEDLVAVSFYTAADNVIYTITIYDDFDGNSLQNLLTTSSGYIEYKGFHTIDLSSIVTLPDSEDFYIFLDLSQGGQPFDRTSYIPVLLGTKTKNIVESSASAGESYYRKNGVWYDLYYNNEIEYPGTANFCIKGLCDDDTGIDQGENSIRGYELEQNYPNPFNPNTTIRFTIPYNNSNVKLVIYNVNGQLASTLLDDVKNMGKHSVDFNASALNSGVYYYSLEVNGVKKDTKKMVLIK